MKRCQSCGYPITGKLREVTPHSDTTARPTLYLHEKVEDCIAAKEERIASPLQQSIRRS